VLIFNGDNHEFLYLSRMQMNLSFRIPVIILPGLHKKLLPKAMKRCLMWPLSIPFYHFKVEDMKKTALCLSAALFALSMASAPAWAAGDAEKGKKLVESKCTTCHAFGKAIAKAGKLGPSLEAGIVGKPAGKVAGFAYSPAMVKMSGEGLTWTEENLDKLLTSPKNFMQGTKMVFPGMPSAEERADAIAFMKTLPTP